MLTGEACPSETSKMALRTCSCPRAGVGMADEAGQEGRSSLHSEQSSQYCCPVQALVEDAKQEGLMEGEKREGLTSQRSVRSNSGRDRAHKQTVNADEKQL